MDINQFRQIMNASGITVFGVHEPSYSFYIHESDAERGMDALLKPGGIRATFGPRWDMKLRPDNEIIHEDGTFETPPPPISVILQNYGVTKYRSDTAVEEVERITIPDILEPNLLTALGVIKSLYPTKTWKYSLVNPDIILKSFGAQSSEINGSDILVGEDSAKTAAMAALSDLQFFYPAISWNVIQKTAAEIVYDEIPTAIIENDKIKYPSAFAANIERLKIRLKKLFPSILWSYEETLPPQRP